MPAIRAIHRIHPTTGGAGLWLDISANNVGLVGFAESAWPAVGGQNATQYGVTLTNLYQGLCDQIIGVLPVSLWFGQYPRGYKVLNGRLVAELIHVAITVLTLSPIGIQVEVTDGVAREVRLDG